MPPFDHCVLGLYSLGKVRGERSSSQGVCPCFFMCEGAGSQKWKEIGWRNRSRAVITQAYSLFGDEEELRLRRLQADAS